MEFANDTIVSLRKFAIRFKELAESHSSNQTGVVMFTRVDDELASCEQQILQLRRVIEGLLIRAQHLMGVVC
jgi:hypothetical protein